MFDQLKELSDRLANVIIENQSFDVLIPYYDRGDAFFYGDPPYFHSEYVYDADFDWEQHVLLRALAKCKGEWLISQADFPEVRELFKDYDILDFQRVHSMAQRRVAGAQFHELLIGNYDLLEREREQSEQISQQEVRRIWDLCLFPFERGSKMKINARIDRVVPKGKVKAVASVSLDGKFVVKNLKIIDGNHGLFVSMPQESYSGKDGATKYSNVFFALTNAARMELQDAVLDAYRQHLDPQRQQNPRQGQSNMPQEVPYQREH